MAIEVPPSRVPQHGPSFRVALAVTLVATVSIVGFALLGKDPATPAPRSSPPAAIAHPAPSVGAAAVTPSPAPRCEPPRVVDLAGPIARSPRPLTPTALETMVPWTGADSALVPDAWGGFWALGAGRLTRLDAGGRMTAAWTFADDPVFGAWDIVSARGGGIWLLGGSNIAWFDGKGLRDVIAAPIPPSGTSWVVDVAEASDGTLWAVANDWSAAGDGTGPQGSVLHWDGRSWSDACGPGARVELAHVAVDAAGGVWVAPNDATRDVSYFDGSSWSVPASDPAWVDDPARRGAWTSELVAADDGSVWRAAGGLARFNGNAWTAVPAGAVDLTGTVALAVAPDGAAWAATGSEWLAGDADGPHTGIVLARSAGRSWTVYGTSDGLPAPEPSSWATITAVGVSRGAVVAAARDGFYRLTGDRWVRTGEPPVAATLSTLAVLLAVSSDEAWAAGFESGLWHFRDGRWTSVPVADWEPPLRVFGIARAPDGTLAVATEQGSAVLRKGRWTVLGDAEAHAVTVEPDGAIWVAERATDATETTVSSFRREGRAWRRTTLPALATEGWATTLVLAPGGEPWLLSRGWGSSLDRFDGTTWVRESPLDGSRPAHVAGLAVAPHGELWAVGAAGDPWRWMVARRDGATWTAPAVPSGLSEQGYPAAFAVAPDGTLWVSTDRGLARFDGERWRSRFMGYGLSALSFAPDGTLWAVGPSGPGRMPADQLAGPDPSTRDTVPPTLSLPDDTTDDGLAP